MRAFLLRRLLHAVFVIWGVVTVVFFLVRLTGDPTLFLVSASVQEGSGSVEIFEQNIKFSPGTDFDHLPEGKLVEVLVDYIIQRNRTNGR